MRKRVLDAARELGYEPNLLAQSLSRGATMTVGFLVRDIASPAVPPILVGAERVLRASGYAMLLTNSEGSPQLDAEYIGVFRRRQVDGLVCRSRTSMTSTPGRSSAASKFPSSRSIVSSHRSSARVPSTSTTRRAR